MLRELATRLDPLDRLVAQAAATMPGQQAVLGQIPFGEEQSETRRGNLTWWNKEAQHMIRDMSSKSSKQKTLLAYPRFSTSVSAHAHHSCAAPPSFSLKYSVVLPSSEKAYRFCL